MLEENYIDINGNRMCWFEWGIPDGRPTILLCHATGFHARCWDQTIHFLGDRHVIAVDFRGHGRSGNEEPLTSASFGDDLARFVAALDLANLTAAGHSMGGHSVVQAVCAEPQRFSRLLLVDPVILDPAAYSGERFHSALLNDVGEHPVARRKNRFADPAAMFANFDGRGAYGLWQTSVLRDYCEHGLLPAPDGDGMVLACPPAVEALIYMGSSGLDLYDRLASIMQPVVVLRAPGRDPAETVMDFSKSPTFAGLADRFPAGKDVYLPDLTHFIPMQRPDLVARYLLEDL